MANHSHTFLVAITVEDEDRSLAIVRVKEVERTFNTGPEDERMHVLLNLEHKEENGGDTYPVIGIHDFIS